MDISGLAPESSVCRFDRLCRVPGLYTGNLASNVGTLSAGEARLSLQNSWEPCIPGCVYSLKTNEVFLLVKHLEKSA